MDDDDHPGPWPRVLISDRQDLPLDAAALVEVARETLRQEGFARVELSLSLVGEDEIAELHERFMDVPGATDVLSFGLDDVDEEDTRLLGDVVVAPAVAARNNPEDLAGELRLLVVHGILHLLGYDHDEDGGRTRMWERQERYSGVRAP